MKTVNQFLLEKLFFNKDTLYPHIYNKYFHDIFPCDEEFIKFLKSNSRELQLNYAKVIVDRMAFGTFNHTLYDAYKNLISFEENELRDKSTGYVPRDHSIHSINTYLLGIYLFFSSKIFFNQIISYFNDAVQRAHYSDSENNVENYFLSFLDSWKIFALNHDISYPIELLSTTQIENKHNCLDLDNVARKLKNKYILYQLTLLSALEIIISNSNISLNNHLTNLDKTKLSDIDYLNYYKLEKFFSVKSLYIFDTVFDYQKLIILVKDKNLNNVVLYKYDYTTSLFIACSLSDNNFKEKLSLDSFNNYDNNDSYNLEFYYPLKNVNLSSLIPSLCSYADDIKKTSEFLLNKFSIEYSNISSHHEYTNFLYKIYHYISISENSPIESEETLLNNLIQVLSKDINDKIKNKNSYTELTQEFESYIKNFDNEKFIQNFNHYLEQINEEDPIYNLKHLKNQIECLIQYFTNRNGIFFDLPNWEISNVSFYPNEVVSIIETFKKMSIENGLLPQDYDMCNLINDVKKDIDGRFDHGISSAYILIETYYYFTQIRKNLIEHKGIKFFNINPLDKNIFVQGCYAIFIHNIYTITFNRIWQEHNNSVKDIKHKILNNPFVYFCLFCDNMQIWDRPLIFSQGQANLPKHTITNFDVSISIKENKIHIKCISEDISDVLIKYREALDSYLDNASQLISLELIDSD